MTAVTDETAFQSLGVYMALPEEAEDPLCFILNGEVAEIQFSYHEIPYSYRASNTAEDFAGIFERFTDQILTVEFKDLEGGETVSAQIRTTQSGGRFASWKWKDTSYTLYTASNVSDAYSYDFTLEEEKEHLKTSFDADGIARGVDWINERLTEEKERWKAALHHQTS